MLFIPDELHSNAALFTLILHYSAFNPLFNGAFVNNAPSLLRKTQAAIIGLRLSIDASGFPPLPAGIPDPALSSFRILLRISRGIFRFPSHFSTDRSAFIRTLTSMGFATCACMPAPIVASTSSLKALAVIARIGMFASRSSFRARIAFAAS